MHIGSRYIFTSAHIVADEDQPATSATTFKLKIRTVERFGVEVLWFNEADDVGLLRSHSVSSWPAAYISCRGAVVA